MTNLLPCPFCGGTSMLLSDTYDNAGSAFECQNCLARGPEADTLSSVHPYHRRDASEIEADAREAWNRRAPSLFGRPVIETDADEALNRVMEELPNVLSWSETPPPDDYSYSEDEEGY